MSPIRPLLGDIYSGSPALLVKRRCRLLTTAWVASGSQHAGA